jgi:hypothetical protein
MGGAGKLRFQPPSAPGDRRECECHRNICRQQQICLARIYRRLTLVGPDGDQDQRREEQSPESDHSAGCKAQPSPHEPIVSHANAFASRCRSAGLTMVSELSISSRARAVLLVSFAGLHKDLPLEERGPRVRAPPFFCFQVICRVRPASCVCRRLASHLARKASRKRRPRVSRPF